MALQTTSPPSAQMVGNAFVEQYYHILYDSPVSVYKFYHDSSVLSRPDPTGEMTSVTTLEVSVLGSLFNVQLTLLFGLYVLLFFLVK